MARCWRDIRAPIVGTRAFGNHAEGLDRAVATTVEQQLRTYAAGEEANRGQCLEHDGLAPSWKAQFQSRLACLYVQRRGFEPVSETAADVHRQRAIEYEVAAETWVAVARKRRVKRPDDWFGIVAECV